MNVFWVHFLHFKLCQTAIFEQVDLRTGYIHLLEALKEEKLTQYLKKGVEGENIVKTYGRPCMIGYLNKSVTALLRYKILAQSTPISLHTEGFVPFVSLITVQRLISIIRNMFSYIGISSCVIVPHTVVAYIFTPTPQSFPFPSPCCQSCPDTSKAVIKQ